MMGKPSKEQIARYEADPEYQAAMERCREIQEQIRPFMLALEQRTPLAQDELAQVRTLNKEFGAAIKRAAKAIKKIAVDSGLDQKTGGDFTATDLANWRKRMRWSQAKAARQLGCSARSIVNWEKGVHTIPKNIPLAISAVVMKLPPYGEQTG